MFKFAFIVILAACAIQAYEVQPFYNDQRDLNDIINQVKDVIEKLKNEASQLLDNFQKIIENLQQSIKEAISKIDIPGIINKIEADLENILKENGIDASQAKACLDAAKTESDTIVKNAEDYLTKCVTKVDDVLRILNDKRLDIEEQAKQISNRASDMILQCIKEHPNPIEAIKCITQHFDELKEEVNVFLQNISDFVTSSQKLVEDTTANLETCIKDVTESVETEISGLVNNFKTCIANMAQNLNSKTTIQEIIQKLKDIIEKIKNLFNGIISDIKELENTIIKFLQDFDINKILEQIKNEIDEILKQNGVNPSAVPDCVKGAEEASSKVGAEISAEAQECTKRVENTIKLIKLRISELEIQANGIITNIQAKGSECVQKPIAQILPCLKELVQSTEQEFNTLVKDIQIFIKQARVILKMTQTDFVVCIKKVKSDLIAKEQDVLHGLQECIKVTHTQSNLNNVN